MIFTTPLYALFLILIFILRWLLPACLRKIGKFKNGQVIDELVIILLLIFSLLFYSAWDSRFLLLLIWVSLVDFACGQGMGRSFDPFRRKLFLWVSLGNGLGVLSVFKYFGFFSENYRTLAGFLGLEAHFSLLQIILPVGISFYIFQSISYTVDVFRREIEPEPSYLHYLLFLSFFPQLVAGPIVTAKEFLPQIRNLQPFSRIPLAFGFFLILLGAFKKSVLADHLAITSDFAFSHPNDLSPSFLWWGVLSYAGQIYCDFSGYTDIAQGSALILGFRLPENFRMPYLARGFSEFWTKWHMSLSGWLRSYLYIPLGGNRKGGFRTNLNLMVVMLLGGLWHGASWNFVFWGGGHGLLLVIERLFSKKRKNTSPGNDSVVSPISGYLTIGKVVFLRLFTFFSVTLLWVFFRSPDFTVSLCYLQGLFSKNGAIAIPHAIFLNTTWCLFALCAGHLVGQKYFKTNAEMEERFGNLFHFESKAIAFGALFSLAFIAIVLLSAKGQPFVYFVF
ncbi:MBOAT family O-acyltransferase [Leptospira ilyithenensis]|uniref:MBOAT family protein n=1 Tax=Leptospira ilyithenensis TaxID=2484901 RepID=A0A4R9LUJ6_9LEPT|nr:MBOAT family O-acyltransferase [Leptospira ilyithenensis]TGN14575.1 MBOAT family protein [Leptospira ilyithenensis]